jgi:hypothetical protein
VAATEGNSIAWLYDITNMASPEVVKIFHLSPVSQYKSPGLAYNEGTLGEIDTESIFFLAPEETANGRAAVVFGGANSGTFSYWEFECEEYGEQVTEGASSAVTAGKVFSFVGAAIFLILLC